MKRAGTDIRVRGVYKHKCINIYVCTYGYLCIYVVSLRLLINQNLCPSGETSQTSHTTHFQLFAEDTNNWRVIDMIEGSRGAFWGGVVCWWGCGSEAGGHGSRGHRWFVRHMNRWPTHNNFLLPTSAKVSTEQAGNPNAHVESVKLSMKSAPLAPLSPISPFHPRALWETDRKSNRKCQRGDSSSGKGDGPRKFCGSGVSSESVACPASNWFGRDLDFATHLFNFSLCSRLANAHMVYGRTNIICHYQIIGFSSQAF